MLSIKKFLFLLILSNLVLLSSVAQTVYTWIGGALGDYQVAANWSPARTVPAVNDILSFDATAPLDIANVPTQTIGALRCQSGTSAVVFRSNFSSTLTLSSATPLVFNTSGVFHAGEFFTLALSNAANFSLPTGTLGIAPGTGGRLSISGTLVLSGGILSVDVSGTGGTVVNSGATVRYISGSFSCSTPSALSWNAGSNYIHEVDGSVPNAIPAALWATGANCTISGMGSGTNAPGGFASNINFGNLIWNCPAQSGTVNLNLPSGGIYIYGQLSINSTNGQSLILGDASGAFISASSFNQTSGNLVLQRSSGNTLLLVTGSFSHTGGLIDGVTGSGTGSGTLNFGGSVNFGASATWQLSSVSNSAQFNVQFTGSSSQTATLSGTWSNPVAGRSNVTIANTSLSGLSLTGTLRVMNSGCPLPATCTITGLLSGSGSLSYSGFGPGLHSLIYSGTTAAQTASAIEFPSGGGPANLVINNSLGVSFPASFNRTVSGTLSMQSGNLSIGAGNTLTLSNSDLLAQLSYTSGFINSGTLSRAFPTTGLPVNATTSASRFPFGTGGNDRSVNVYFSGTTLTGGSSGNIAISHAAAIGATSISVTDGILLDKRSNSSWSINTGTFNLGSGGQTITLTAQGNNLGSIDDISTLRLTNAVSAFGTHIPATGALNTPLLGKSGLTLADINGQTLYCGSNTINALTVITFTWIGAISNSWTNPANWTGAVGFPNSLSEIAIINTAASFQPTVPSGTNIELYQLTVGSGSILTLSGSATINVSDTVRFSGTSSFSSNSTFIYSGSNASQPVAAITYGNLELRGSAPKIFPATVTVTGRYRVSGAAPNVTTNNNTFIYAGSSDQEISNGSYHNLTITGNRGGGQIRLGLISTSNTIDIANVFNVSGLSNYSVRADNNTINFSASGTQTIPGFRYNIITNFSAPANARRVLDPLGSANQANVIECLSLDFNGRSFNTSMTDVDLTGSKIRYVCSGLGNATFYAAWYNDLEIAGNLNGFTLDFQNNIDVVFLGNFLVTATNYKQGTNNFRFWFGGTKDITIGAYKTNVATNTPAFRYSDVNIKIDNRIVTLGGGGTDTIGIRGYLSLYNTGYTPPAGKGFIVAGSTVNFISGSSNIPYLLPASGTASYNNIVLSSGTRTLAANMTLSGNLTILGRDGAPATFYVGNGSANRTLTIGGNLSLNGSSASSTLNSQLDLNVGSGSATINLAGNLSLNGFSQITSGIAASNGLLVFNGTNQQYSNTSAFKNGNINFTIGNGINPTRLTLNNNIELARSSNAAYQGILTVSTNATLDCGPSNINIGSGTSGNAVVNLNNGSWLITANTGGIEGAATSNNTGTILNTSTITKNYNAGASYQFNGATTTPFPSSISTMQHLSLGTPITLNRAITATGTLNLGNSILTQNGNNLQFSGLADTTGSIAADAASGITISGTSGTVGRLRFAPGFRITGLLNIDRPVTVQLSSDLVIDRATLPGNFISGNAASVLDINGNSLTINGAISGPGALSGSATSNLSLGGLGAVGNLRFTSGKGVLRNLTLNNSAQVNMVTPLDIAAGVSPGNEGSLTVTGTAKLTTGGMLTIKSDSIGTARIAQGDAFGGYIIGDVTVERYIPRSSRRGWRLLGVPTYGQTIRQAWMENQPAGVNGAPGFGTIITSNNANWSSLGFDYYTPGNSMLTYNQATNTWVGINNTGLPLSSAGANRAYMLFIRGDRASTTVGGTPASATTLRTKGTVFQGNQAPVTITTPGTFAMIGNNYPCAIDFTAIIDANINQEFRVWDPKIMGANGLGGYQTFSATTGWKPIPGGGSYPAGISNTFIQSGQAFAVYSTSGNGNVTLRENAKVNGSQQVFRPYGTTPASMRASLYAMVSGTPVIADGNIVVLDDEFADEIDNKDAVKLINSGENFGIIRQQKILTIDARKPFQQADTVFYDIRRLRQQSYRFVFTPEQLSGVTEAYLEDSYLNQATPVSLYGETSVDFSINADSASFNSRRFRLVFRNAAVLPVRFTGITLGGNSGNRVLGWQVAGESGIRHYVVERSTNGRDFSVLASTPATGRNNYTWTDVLPIPGDVFYRVKAIGFSGDISYSRIVKGSSNPLTAQSAITPNPSSGEHVGVQLQGIKPGVYQSQILNAQGQTVHRQMLVYGGGNSMQSIELTVTLASGNYVLELLDSGKQVLLLPFVVAR